MTTGKLRLFAISLGTIALLLPAVGLTEEPQATKPGVSIARVTITPENPGVDTLCRLSVELTNEGKDVASQLGFRVTINGSNIPVYDNQLFMYPLEPGAANEVALFNFWSTETSRLAPADGKLRVEVALVEAQWTKIEDVDGVETWTPLGAVPGLPVSKTVTLPMAKQPPR